MWCSVHPPVEGESSAAEPVRGDCPASSTSANIDTLAEIHKALLAIWLRILHFATMTLWIKFATMTLWIKFATMFCLVAMQVRLVDGFLNSHRYSARSSRVHLAMDSKYLGKDPVFIAGGSSGIGLEVIKKLSERGTPVRVLVRREDAKEYLNTLPGVTALMGDALDAAAVQDCMKGCVAAVTTLGGQPLEGQTVRVDYAGNSNVIEQAGILGVERIILVTSVGCGDTIGAIPTPAYRALESVLTEKTRAERDLKMYTNLDWTILRPGGLKNVGPTGRAILTEDKMASGSVDRRDVADMIIKVLGSSGLCTRREFTVVDPSYNSEYTYQPFQI